MINRSGLLLSSMPGLGQAGGGEVLPCSFKFKLPFILRFAPRNLHIRSLTGTHQKFFPFSNDLADNIVSDSCKLANFCKEGIQTSKPGMGRPDMRVPEVLLHTLKKWILARKRPNLAQTWHFWPSIGIFGPFDPMPDQKTMQTRCLGVFLCYVGTKTFAFSCKN